MIPFDVPAIVPLALVLFGFAAFYQAYKTYGRYAAVRETAPAVETGAAGDATTVSGPVSTVEPAAPRREPPEGVIDGTARPALVAWRVRRHVSGGRNGRSRWRTADGGLAVGEFDVRHGGRYVRIDGDTLPDAGDDGHQSADSFDPFDDSALELGEPETDVRLGEPDPLTKVLERLRLIGTNGVLGDPNLSLSIGGNSLSPDRYQATVVDNGDEIAIEGELAETRDGPVLQRSGGDRPTVVVGTLEKRESQLRSLALKQAGLGGAMIALGYVVSAVA
ncbi:hypothetical protein RBH26_08685 [Natronolimnohabitans sp. A-GB9]|uniref:hypothetical protein n=1 Tax=Natronolimnohabitans sp. A-GB9 TaxID=3069757 RepID=UPI0027B5128D|nr:hypothetical protein [Natronolimnohabitans sp. A-GB9]MDQ2050562.1 hypothetical protein [Natronolimnohabitans sp. A-GB9]